MSSKMMLIDILTTSLNKNVSNLADLVVVDIVCYLMNK